MRRLRHLTGQHRTPYMNRLLGGLLAFNAGAINAGGVLVVGMYTSHMTGFVSFLADNLVLGNMTLVLSAVGALLAFTVGAAVTAVLVNWARQHHLRSEYALPLLLEAMLMLVFGLLGATLSRQTPFAVPLTVLVLAFTMGLQNALVSKISSSQIRTTHMTGVITDLGIELGKMFYWNRTTSPLESRVRALTSCKPISRPNLRTPPTAWRPRPSCANACTAVFAQRRVRRTNCWVTNLTARVAASISSSRCWKAKHPHARPSCTWTGA
jgi:uncharacterized membrane protein YoaK (UPF0700 family)